MDGAQGRCALVIGGSSGLGRAAARALAARAVDVTVTSRRADRLPAAIDGVCDGLRPVQGAPRLGAVDAITCDLTDEREAARQVERLGPLDFLVVTGAPDEPSDPETHDRAFFEAKLWGTRAVVDAAAERMPDDGAVVLLSGLPAVRPLYGMWLLTCAFGVTEALTRALAVDLAPRRINCLRVGVFDSTLWDSMDEAQRRDWYAWSTGPTPMGRPGTVDEFGEAVVAALTSSFMTGAVIPVDGGTGVTWGGGWRTA